MKRIIIIGGGLSGLAAAYELEKQEDTDITWDIYEAQANFSGKFKTVKRDGFLIEKGPDSFLARKPAGMELIAELGLTSELIANATGHSYIYHDNGLHPIPEGAVMGVPTDEKALLASSLLSVAGKERAILEKKLPYQKSTADQSLGQFFEERFGKELVKRLIEPLLSGIYAGDIYQMSLRTTFPQFERIIEQHGNLMSGLKNPHKVEMATTGTKQTIGAFRTLAGGLESFPKAIATRLGKEHLHANKQAVKLTKLPVGGYIVTFSDGTKEEADGILIAATHDTLIRLLDKETTAPFANQPLTTLATISLAYPDAERAHLPEGTGYLVARTKNYHSTACTWVHKKWPHMVPTGKMLLRGFVGKAFEDEITGKSDDELINIVLADYKEMMGLNETPIFAEVSRMNRAMPNYQVGHLERLEALHDNIEANYPGVAFCGMSYNGVGIPDCIALARSQADKLFHEVKAR